MGCNDLRAKVGGSVDESPIRAQGIFRVWRYGDLRLGAWTRFERAVAEAATVWTATIPLGKSAPGCGAEEFYAHSGTFTGDRLPRSNRLELGVGVRANFAVEVDFFVPRGNPFHGRRLLLESNAMKQK